MTIWHCCNAFECLYSILMLHAVGPSEDQAIEIQRKIMHREIARTLARFTVGDIGHFLDDESGVTHFLIESMAHAQIVQRGQLPTHARRPVSIGNISGSNFTDALFRLIQFSQQAISDAQNAIAGAEGNLGDVCGFTLRKIGEVDFTLLRSGLKIEWSELSPKFADDALVSCEDIAIAWNLEAKTVRNHYRKAWGKPVAKRGRHDVWRFGTIKTIVMQQKSEEE